MSGSQDIVLFYYTFSPYAKRIVWYLTLRGIPYSQCLQPVTMPRPDLVRLGVRYRRIPICSIGRDVYCDTRLILRKLEELFPGNTLGSEKGEGKALERLLERWTNDGGVFWTVAGTIPPESDIMKDDKFLKDRTEFTGRTWSADVQAKGRPEALVRLRDAFTLLETTLLADGRDWILKTDKPTLADIEGVWPFHWVLGLPGAVPAEVASEKTFPKVFAWVDRFDKAIKDAQVKTGEPSTLDADQAVKKITSAQFAERLKEVDPTDPTQLKAGTAVDVYPVDSGFEHRDQGTLDGLTPDEIVITVKAENDQEIHLHAPRWGFRVAAASNAKM